MQNRGKFTNAVLIIAAGLLIFYGLTLFRSRSRRGENPYAYDLGSLKEADSSLVHYSEIEPILFQGKKLTALTVNFSDELIVAAGREIYRVDSTAGPRLWINTQYPVRCLASGEEGVVYVGLENIVSVYQPDGTKVADWEEFPRQAILTSIDTGEDVFVADAGTKVVHRFSRAGRLISRIGEKDPVKKIPGFVVPSPYFDLAVDQTGSVWVVNPGRHTLEHYSPDGDLTESWGKTSMRIDGFSGCCNPTHIAIAKNDAIVTSEKGLVRIKVYSRTGQMIDIVALPDQFDDGTVGIDLAVDSKGRIFTLDPSRSQVRIFIKPEDEKS
jgi:ligand-binding sensor domain-containing protein